jgi:hypothetical protein
MSETIYIQLLNEGTPSWRPTIGLKLYNRNYKVTATETYDSTDEEWEFKPGSIVRCEFRDLSDGTCLVAVEELRKL